MEDAERELRKVILLLVQAHKHHQIRGATSADTLVWLMNLHPTKRNEITRDQIQKHVAALRREAEKEANKQTERLERALSGEEPFLELLQVYASQQFWTQ